MPSSKPQTDHCALQIPPAQRLPPAPKRPLRRLQPPTAQQLRLVKPLLHLTSRLPLCKRAPLRLLPDHPPVIETFFLRRRTPSDLLPIFKTRQPSQRAWARAAPQQRIRQHPPTRPLILFTVLNRQFLPAAAVLRLEPRDARESERGGSGAADGQSAAAAAADGGDRGGDPRLESAGRWDQ